MIQCHWWNHTKQWHHMSPLQDFSLSDNTSLIPRVYPNSKVFTIMIRLQQDSFSERVDYIIENYNLYNLLNNT
jgi:hypothetical protein